jgi:hypothetical protein
MRPAVYTLIEDVVTVNGRGDVRIGEPWTIATKLALRSGGYWPE